MSVINTNFLALVSQNNLTKSQNALGTAIERLSSGLRINSAKDDAAGQAIANRFTANINGLQQASRNANDGISIAQTTEGSLNEINENLQRIRVLTNQAVNGTNSDTDLKSIQDEIDQRLGEINRVSEQTQFNGVKVLAEERDLKIQVGAHDGQTITVKLKEITSNTLGLSGFNVNGNGSVQNKAATLADVKAVSGVQEVVADKHYQISTNNTKVAAQEIFDTSSGVVTVVGAADEDAFGTALGWAGEVSLTGLVGDGSGSYSYSVTDATDAEVGAKITAASNEKVLANYSVGGKSIDIQIDDNGDITDRNGNGLFLTSDGELTLNNAGSPAATATNLAAAVSSASATLSVVGGPTYTGNGTADEIAVTGVVASAEDLATISTVNAAWTFTVGSSIDGSFASVTVSGANGVQVNGTDLYKGSDGAFTLAEETTQDLYIHTNGNVTGADAAQYFVDSAGNLTLDSETAGTTTLDPLEKLDKALADVDALRSELGAVQNRFSSTIANLANTVNNLSAARSRIQDADYAVEVSNMTRAQILQQAGTSVLAQANQVPQGVLSLLR